MALRMLAIPAGSITLRDARRASWRTAALEPFTIAATPVTRAQLAAVAGTTITAPGDALAAHGIRWREAIDWCVAASIADGLAPAYEVDDDAVIWHAAADGYRLPTEAEWEWACRARTREPTYGPLEQIAWTASDGVDGPQPVAGKAANAWGLHDVLGNVWEWCWDLADPARYADYRVLRGGGWADRPWSVRASVRRATAPDALLEDVGFRVARGAVAGGGDPVQGWSEVADRERAAIAGPLPVGWTPLGRTPRRTPPIGRL